MNIRTAVGLLVAMPLLYATNHEAHDKKRIACYHHYLQGAYHHAHGNLETSIASYKKALVHHPSPHAHIGLLRALADAGKVAEASQLIEQHYAAFREMAQQSVPTALLCTQILVTAQHSKGPECIELTWKHHANDQQIPFALATILAQQGQHQKALSYLQEGIANKALTPHHFMYHFLASKILLEQGNPKLALEHIEKSISLSPQHDRRILLRGVLLQQLGRAQEAIGCFQGFLHHVGSDSAVEQQLVALLFAQNRFTEAAPYLDRIAAQGPEHAVEAAIIHLRAGNAQRALSSIQEVLEKHPDQPRARLMHIDLLLGQNKQTEALQSLIDWVNAAPHQVEPCEAFWLLYKTGAQAPVLITQLEKLTQQHQSIPLLATLGDLYAAQNDLNNASKTYRKIFALKPPQAIKTHLTFQLAHLCYRARRFDLVERILSPHQEKTNHAPSCNLLAYVYVHGKRNLEVALKLVNKALSQEPRNAAYLDTKALIMHAMGNKPEAIALLRQAILLAPQDLVIRQHMVQLHKQ